MTIKMAGETYAKLSAASNAARDRWMGAPKPTKANLTRHKKLAAGAADATVAFSEGLRKHHWPAEAQPIIGTLDEHLQQRAAAYKRVAAAGTVVEYLAAAREVAGDQFPDRSGASGARLARSRSGPGPHPAITARCGRPPGQGSKPQ
jgi:hypothetical protein